MKADNQFSNQLLSCTFTLTHFSNRKQNPLVLLWVLLIHSSKTYCSIMTFLINLEKEKVCYENTWIQEIAKAICWSSEEWTACFTSAMDNNNGNSLKTGQSVTYSLGYLSKSPVCKAFTPLCLFFLKERNSKNQLMCM